MSLLRGSLPPLEDSATLLETLDAISPVWAKTADPLLLALNLQVCHGVLRLYDKLLNKLDPDDGATQHELELAAQLVTGTAVRLRP